MHAAILNLTIRDVLDAAKDGCDFYAYLADSLVKYDRTSTESFTGANSSDIIFALKPETEYRLKLIAYLMDADGSIRMDAFGGLFHLWSDESMIFTIYSQSGNTAETQLA